MNINFKDESSITIDPAVAGRVTAILDDIDRTGLVSTETILSLESCMGSDSIPNSIKNTVSSSPSSHGRDDLIRLMRAACPATNRYTPVELYATAYRMLNKLSNTDLNKVIDVMISERIAVNKLYVPKAHRLPGNDEAWSLGDYQVSTLVGNSVLSNYIGRTDLNLIKMLRRLPGPSVPLGSSSILCDIANWNYWECSRGEKYTVHFACTIDQYIVQQISQLRELSKVDITEASVAVARLADAAGRDELEDPCVDRVAILTDINIVLTNDTYVEEIINHM